MFWKKKTAHAAKLELGVDVKRCAECGKFQRPCLADGKPAIFHRWAPDDRAFLRFNVFLHDSEQRELWREFHRTGFVPGGCSVEVQQRVVALVEYPDGSVGEVKPELIQFLDRGDERMG